MRPSAVDTQRLDPAVLEQALLWMVRLQSGASSDAEQLACLHWRQEHATHEQAWQRLASVGHGLREGARGVSAQGARHLLRARAQVSRRAVLGGLAGAGVLIASGYGLSQRSLLPVLLSDYSTSTGQRRSWRLREGVDVQLDTRTALDSDEMAGVRVLTLNRGRVLLEVAQGTAVSVRTAQSRILPGAASRLIVQQQAAATLVQVLAGAVQVESGQGAAVPLTAGWQQLFGNQPGARHVALPAGAGAWTHGHLVAERTPLHEVLNELDLYRPGVLRCDPRVAGLQVSGAFSVDQPDASLALLTEVLPIRVQRVLGYWATVMPA